MGQMADAGAHGAGNSPEFDRRWTALADSTQRLRDQLIRDGKDVSEFDDRLRDDLRQIMRAKGKADAEIDALLAAHPGNPIDAMRAFIMDQKGNLTQRDLDAINAKISIHEREAAASSEPHVIAQALPVGEAVSSFGAALAGLGVVASDHESSGNVTHGVNTNSLAINGPSVIRS
jgi:hypothetical protein